MQFFISPCFFSSSYGSPCMYVLIVDSSSIFFGIPSTLMLANSKSLRILLEVALAIFEISSI
jgi:hypothetical protein